jgi:phosphohistidine phosphatase
MERTLVLIRHAKSSWANPMQSDFDRPLNDRGEQEAPEMGEKLKSMHIVPDLIISSTAKRTRQTAKRIAKKVGFDTDEIKWEDRLYHCIPSVFERVINDVDNKVKTVFIVAHNPGITEFANQLSPDFAIDNLHTCGIIGAHMDLEEWENFANVKRKVFLFEYPGK